MDRYNYLPNQTTKQCKEIQNMICGSCELSKACLPVGDYADGPRTGQLPKIHQS